MGKSKAVLARDAADLQGKDGYKHRFAFKVVPRVRDHLYVYPWLNRPKLVTNGSWNESHPLGGRICLCVSGIHAFDTLQQTLDGELAQPLEMLKMGNADLWLVELAGEKIARNGSKCAARFCRFVLKFKTPAFGWDWSMDWDRGMEIIHADLAKQFDKKFWKPRRGEK